MNTMLSDILFDTSYLFIITGCIIALIFGLALMFIPNIALKMNDKINTQISFRKQTKKIETPIHSEPFFYRYAKTSGALLAAGSAYVLYTLTTFNLDSLIPYLPKSLPIVAWEWFLQAGQIFFFITCAFILAFGLVVLIRPSQLKNFETKANRWISTRQSFQKMTTDINTANKLVNNYPRAFGSFVTIFALIILFLLLPEL